MSDVADRVKKIVVEHLGVEAEKVTDTINAIVEEQLMATKLGINDTITTMVKTMTSTLVKSIVERVDVYSLQTALREALKSEKLA